jgi:hypothetical protein
VALEASTEADARVACAFLKAEEVAAQHAAELRDLKAAATGHADELQKLRTKHANTLLVLRQEYTTQTEALRTDLGKERQVLEIMKATYRRKLEAGGANVKAEEEGCNTCIICLDGGADQMPFECQHVVMCGGTFLGAAGADIRLCRPRRQRIQALPVLHQQEAAPVSPTAGRADGRKARWRVYLAAEA